MRILLGKAMGHSILLLAIAAYSLSLSDSLVYTRDGVLESWRIFTCHLMHWNFGHLFWSTGTFLVLGSLCERDGRGQFLACSLISAVAIPAVLWRFTPELLTYGGLSGVDCALFVILATGLLREKWAAREWRWVALSAAVLGAYAAKIGFEVITGGTVFLHDTTGMLPVPMVHVAGGISGALLGFFWPGKPLAATVEHRGVSQNATPRAFPGMCRCMLP